MNFRGRVTMLIRATTLMAMASPQAGFATTCSDLTPQEFLENPALIFEGTIRERAVRDNYIVTRYGIDVLYKGVIDGDTVEIASHCGFIECPKNPTYSSQRHIVGAVLSQSSAAEHPPFVTFDCTNLAPNSQPAAYLPHLDSYRVALVNAYRRAEAAPRNLQLWGAVAALQLKHHDSLGALDTLQKLRKLAPTRAQYVVQTGDSLRGLKRYPEALAEYDAAIELGGVSDAVRAGKFQVFAATDRFTEIDADWRDFSDMELSNVRFAGRSLQAARFMRATLYECDLTGVDLTGADFSDSEVRGCKFSGAILRNARLRHAILQKLNLPRGLLAGADLTGAELYGAELPGADLSRVDLTDTNLRQANLSGANLKGAIFLRTSLIEADLSKTDLSGADLRRIELQGAILRNARLVGANLRGAYLAGLPVGQRGPNHAGDWRPADLTGADLTDAILLGADLREALYDCTTKFPRGFVPRGLKEVASQDCEHAH